MGVATGLLQGQRAQRFVSAWTWDSVAAQYLALLAHQSVKPLSPDPFTDTFGEAAARHVSEASWVADTLTLFSGAAWDFSQDGAPADWAPGLCALFADVDIQVWHAPWSRTLLTDM